MRLTSAPRQFIAEEKERLGSEQAFWTKYQRENSQRLGFKAILDRLRDERKERDKQAYVDAMTCFSGDLDSPLAKGAFRYTKRGATYLSRRQDTVAKIWRQLLADDAEVAKRWQELQDELQDVIREFEGGLGAGVV